MGTLSVVGTILLFFRREDTGSQFKAKPDTDDRLFTEILNAAEPRILSLWSEGHRYLKDSTQCKEELFPDPKIGASFYDCQPHFWQCYWQGGVTGESPTVKVDLYGQTYHVVANSVFPAIPEYSPYSRFYRLLKLPGAGLNIHYGMEIELSIRELPGLSRKAILTDSCRDTYLPERIYAHGKRPAKGDGFIWDNFGRRIFVDRFYVTNQMINEWMLLKGEKLHSSDRREWPRPALLSISRQREYCSFLGKRLLTTEIFDAASMTPVDFNNPKPAKVVRAQTPWQRDITKSFLGVARINPDYQLTPLDCQLAQVQGCQERLFASDSASWMGMNFPLGFWAESLENNIEPAMNLKLSSRNLPPASPWHELGARSSWKGEQEDVPVAFRCYEEVEP